MSFFKKLKSKLFKSSSKLDEGLDAIVADGGVAEEVETEIADTAAEQAAEEEERARLAEIAAEEARLREAEIAEAEAAKQRLADEQAAEARREAALKAEAERAAEAARFAAEKRAAEEAQAAARDAEARLRAEEQAKEAAAREAHAAARAEEERREAAARAAAEEAAARAEREAAKQQRAAEEQARTRAAEAQAARLKAEEEAKRTAREAEEAAKPSAAAALANSAVDEEAPTEEKKPGLFGRLLGRKEKKTVIRRELDDDMLEALEELLIASDMGVDTALRVTANMAEGRFGKKLSTQEIKELLAREIATIMEPVARPMPLYPKRPQVVLVVGVNGSGKTTTIGKLASQFRAAGKKVVIAAGDTFRAAAVEQLQVWGERAGVPVLTAPEGSDPASLAFEAMTKAEADGADLLMIDTAGRLQNRADLMEELAKIVRVIRKKDETAPHNTLLVLDATTGQNALNQVDVFRNISDVSGLVMTKLDGTAKGGVLVALADKFGLPIHAIGVGEQIDDLAPFDPEEFAQALTGIAAE